MLPSFPQIKSRAVLLNSTSAFQFHTNDTTRPPASTHAASAILSSAHMLLLSSSTALSLLRLIAVILFSLVSLTSQTPAAADFCSWIITHTPSRDHPVLHQLHGLTVDARVSFKIMLLTVIPIHKLAPPYLCDLLHSAAPSRSFKSLSSIHLIVPSARLTIMENKPFSHSAS